LILAQYKAAPEVTRKRLWLETMEQVMADNPKVIDGSGGRNIINLPIPQGAAATSEAGSATVGAIVPTPAPATGNAADKGTQP
jgi:modulator of FtsH protease HflK